MESGQNSPPKINGPVVVARITYRNTQHRGPTQRTHTEGTRTGDPHRGPTQGTHTEGTHTGDPHRGPAQGTHTGDPHRGEGPTEDPPPEGRATQGTHTEHTQTCKIKLAKRWP